MKLVINKEKLKQEFPYELLAFFINTVTIVDLLRMLMGDSTLLGLVRNGIYIVTALCVLYHAAKNRHLSKLVGLGVVYGILAAFSLLLSDGLTDVILSGSMIFLTRCVTAFYLGCYVPADDIFFKKLKKYYVLLIVYCLLYVTTHTSGIYATDGSYMTFSYNILIMTTILMLRCIQKPSLTKIIGSVILIGVIVAYGARGPILCLVVSVLLFLLYKFSTSPAWKKIIFSVSCVAIGIGLFQVRNVVIDFLISINPSSRTLYLLKNFKLDDLSGRNAYYDILTNDINLIKPHGLYSDRSVLGEGLASGGDLSQYYAHNVVIEVLYHFGAFLGLILLIGLLVKLIKSLIYMVKRNDPRTAILYCAFFTGITTLFFSSSYLINERTWLALGIVFSITMAMKKKPIQSARIRHSAGGSIT